MPKLKNKLHCYICKQYKDRNSFYLKNKNSINRMSRCKNCHNKNRVNKLKATNYKYSNKYHLTVNGKKSWAKASQKARIKHQDKWTARTKLREAVRKGEIIKPVMCEKYSPQPK